MQGFLDSIWVIARRDGLAVVRSKAFVMFLLGPLLLMGVGLMGGRIGQAAVSTEYPVIGLAMDARSNAAMLAAHDALAGRMAGPMPDFIVIHRMIPGESFDARTALRTGHGQLAAVISGTPTAPILATTRERITDWDGMVSLIAARAAGQSENIAPFPPVVKEIVLTSAAHRSMGRRITAMAGQTLLFLLTMMLSTMVLSNLVEEKGNKIIEVIAAAIPLESLFLGKLVAMLAVSFLGIGVWGASLGGLLAIGAKALPALSTPAVGWPLFIGLGMAYFSMAYLLLGSVYLAIGGMAATVRDIQTLALPASLLQVAMFGFASYALERHGSQVEWAAMIFPLSSPFIMLARAAVDEHLWPHAIAIAWQAVVVAVFISGGARLFRAKVLKSSTAGWSKGLARRIRRRA